MSSEEKAKELAEKYGNQTAIAICEEMKKMLNEWKSPVAITFIGGINMRLREVTEILNQLPETRAKVNTNNNAR